jgi:ABC-type bacteriocin/lantibiotic exporter with double-glycine peptidase domain
MQLQGVPLIQQEKENSCWHASARMLYGYKRKACIHPLPKKYDADQGISASEFIELAKAVGLCTLPKVNMCYAWTFIDDLLRYYGPIWAAGNWNGPNHIIVITGVNERGSLYVNDPAFSSPKVRDVGWFNDKVAKDVPVPLMYLP